MKARMTTLVIAFAFLLLCALSMGNRMYLLLSLVLALACGLAYLSVRLTERSISVSHSLSHTRVNRGDQVNMRVSITHKGFLPIAPVKLNMRQTSNTPSGSLRLSNLSRRKQSVYADFSAAHVGAMQPGVDSFEVSDVFGFFTKTHQPDNEGEELLVLPVTFEVEPLAFAAGDMGVETMKRAMEDPSSPADFRNYQQGDPLKRIHWKMTARRRELVVRQFEEPALPDALVLMDTSPPFVNPGIDPAKAPYLQDALLETAASVVNCQIKLDNPVRMPLVGDRPMEYNGAMGLPVLLEELARVTFNESERFERVLLLQMGELRKTGAVVIITSRVTSTLADLIIRMKRMGPNVRLYLITFTPDSETVRPLVGRLQAGGVEVNYVEPS